ncbi:MAG: nucleotidyltransferase domain-containing protein [Candidatus Woesearchaeota archaeon]
MLYKTELTILKLLFEDLTKGYSIRELSLILKLPYPQIHRTISSLKKKDLIKKQQQGKSWIINLNLENVRDDYIAVEMERKKEIIHTYKTLNLLIKDLERVSFNQFVCILFGSYAEKRAKKESDLDLLFVIPEDYNYEQFEKAIKNAITLPNLDLNITTEKGLTEMWSNPLKLNVGNELLKKHVILYGAEQFLRLRRKYYVG